MAMSPETEEPGFEADVNELPHDVDNGDENRLEDGPWPETTQSACG